MYRVFGLLSLCLMVALAGCGGGGGGSSKSASTTATGQFIDAPVEGLTYESGALKGVTDANGTFEYEVGKSVTFSIGGKVVLGSATGSSVITPLDLAPDQADGLDIVRILMTLDDNPASDKMRIPAAVRTAASLLSSTEVQNLSDVLMTALVTALGVDGSDLATAQQALAHITQSQGTLTVYATGSYDVWASNDTAPQSDVPYYNVQNLSSYRKIGSGTTTASFAGNYRYYVIAAPTVIHFDAVKLPDGTYPPEEDHSYDHYLSWGNVHTPDDHIYGAPDGQTNDVGALDGSEDSQYAGFVVVRNPAK